MCNDGSIKLNLLCCFSLPGSGIVTRRPLVLQMIHIDPEDRKSAAGEGEGINVALNHLKIKCCIIINYINAVRPYHC